MTRSGIAARLIGSVVLPPFFIVAGVIAGLGFMAVAVTAPIWIWFAKIKVGDRYI